MDKKLSKLGILFILLISITSVFAVVDYTTTDEGVDYSRQLWGEDQREEFIQKEDAKTQSIFSIIFSLFDFLQPPPLLSIVCDDSGEYQKAYTYEYYCHSIGDQQEIRYGTKNSKGVEKVSRSNRQGEDFGYIDAISDLENGYRCWEPPPGNSYFASWCGIQKGIECKAIPGVRCGDSTVCVDGKSTCQPKTVSCTGAGNWEGQPYASNDKIIDDQWTCPDNKYVSKTVIDCASKGWDLNVWTATTKPAGCNSKSGYCDGTNGVQFYHYGWVCLAQDSSFSCTSPDYKDWRCDNNRLLSEYCLNNNWVTYVWDTCYTNQNEVCDPRTGETTRECRKVDTTTPVCVKGNTQNERCVGDSKAYEVCEDTAGGLQWNTKTSSCPYGCSNGACKSAPSTQTPSTDVEVAGVVSCILPDAKCGTNGGVISYRQGTSVNNCQPVPNAEQACGTGQVCKTINGIGTCTSDATFQTSTSLSSCNLIDTLRPLDVSIDSQSSSMSIIQLDSVANQVGFFDSLFSIASKPTTQKAYRPGDFITVTGITQKTSKSVKEPGYIVTVKGPYVYNNVGKRTGIYGSEPPEVTTWYGFDKSLYPTSCPAGNIPVTAQQHLLKFNDEGLDLTNRDGSRKYNFVEYDVSYQLGSRRSLYENINPCVDSCGMWTSCTSPVYLENGDKKVILSHKEGNLLTGDRCVEEELSCSKDGLKIAGIIGTSSPAVPLVGGIRAIAANQCIVGKVSTTQSLMSLESLQAISGIDSSLEPTNTINYKPVTSEKDVVTVRISYLTDEQLSKSDVTVTEPGVPSDQLKTEQCILCGTRWWDGDCDLNECIGLGDCVFEVTDTTSFWGTQYGTCRPYTGVEESQGIACKIDSDCPQNFCSYQTDEEDYKLKQASCISNICVYQIIENCRDSNAYCSSGQCLGPFSFCLNDRAEAVVGPSKYVCLEGHYNIGTKKWVCDSTPQEVVSCGTDGGLSATSIPKAIYSGLPEDVILEPEPVKPPVTPPVTDLCGNDKLDAGEDCDASLPFSQRYKDDKTQCQDYGEYGANNEEYVGCTGECKVNLDNCGTVAEDSFCGDGIRQKINGDGNKEECDTLDIPYDDCTDYNSEYTSGNLLCDSSCKIDDSLCTSKSDNTCTDGTAIGKCSTKSVPKKCDADLKLVYNSDCCPDPENQEVNAEGQCITAGTCTEEMEGKFQCIDNTGTANTFQQCLSGNWTNIVTLCPDALCHPTGCFCLASADCGKGTCGNNITFNKVCNAQRACVNPTTLPKNCTVTPPNPCENDPCGLDASGKQCPTTSLGKVCGIISGESTYKIYDTTCAARKVKAREVSMSFCVETCKPGDILLFNKCYQGITVLIGGIVIIAILFAIQKGGTGGTFVRYTR